MGRRAGPWILLPLVDPDTASVVLGVVADITGFPAESLAEHLDDDLVSDLGVDSVRLTEIWVGIESRLGLEIGEIGVRQLPTIRSIVDHVSAARLPPV